MNKQTYLKKKEEVWHLINTHYKQLYELESEYVRSSLLKVGDKVSCETISNNEWEIINIWVKAGDFVYDISSVMSDGVVYKDVLLHKSIMKNIVKIK